MTLLAHAEPMLRTERLELWLPQASDLPSLVALVASDETRRFLGATEANEQHQFNRLMRHAGGWSLFGYGTFFVRLPGAPEIVGSCGMFHSWRGFGKGLDDVPEAGWIIHRDHWGKGYAQEAMRVALAWFDAAHGPRRIAAMITEGNIASHRVAKALGFTAYGEQIYEGSPLVLYERVSG